MSLFLPVGASNLQIEVVLEKTGVQSYLIDTHYCYVMVLASNTGLARYHSVFEYFFFHFFPEFSEDGIFMNFQTTLRVARDRNICEATFV